MSNNSTVYQGMALSRFCLQISILLKSAVPLSDGLEAMAEDAGSEGERRRLLAMAEQLREGEPLSSVLAESGAFPDYMIQTARLGETTGSMDICMESLAAHYEQEYYLSENVRRAITYPAMMVVMLLVILFVLFSRVMPVFTGVYESLGASIPAAAAAAMEFGTIFSGAALVLAAAAAVVMIFAALSGRMGAQPAWIRSLYRAIENRSAVARAASLRRICSAVSLSIKSGLRTEEGIHMAMDLIQNEALKKELAAVEAETAAGSDFYEAVKKTSIFTGFDLQMLRTGSRAGQLDSVLDSLAEDYAQKSQDAVERMISMVEPAVVAVLAVAVGLVLLAVMLPLAGILSTIGV